jgi:hypothetical protein
MINGMPGVSAVWISPEGEMDLVTGGPQILFGKGP